MQRQLLAEVRTIVTHESCADGTVSAILLHDALPRCDVIFVEYIVERGIRMRVSLRSNGSFDCGAFAQARGGGGHTHAAGFSIAVPEDAPQALRLIEQMFAAV